MSIVKNTESRDKTCAVRLSDSEFFDLQKASEMTGSSMSSIMREGTRLKIERIHLEALEKEASRKQLENEIMSKLTCLDNEQKQELLASFHASFLFDKKVS